MNDDERAIRALIDTWMAATSSGDTATVLGLMANDVLFMVAGREPFGKEAFAASSEAMKGVRIESTSTILELEVHGDWAWCRSRLTVSVSPPRAKPMKREGSTLTLFKKGPNGAWVLSRDANMLALVVDAPNP